MVAVGRTPAEPPPPPGEMQRLGLETVPLPRKEVDYPAMREMHAASSLKSAGDCPPSTYSRRSRRTMVWTKAWTMDQARNAVPR